jgi:hypothetical protein
MALRFDLKRVCALVACLSAPTLTGAQNPETQGLNERCAIRLSIALTGRSPEATLMAAANPQQHVASLIGSAAFVDRFASFINAELNKTPGSGKDATYWVVKHVLENNRPWKDVFNGRLNAIENDDGTMQVRDDPDGLGYFRSLPWLRRYAGNEPTGLKLTTAFRMLQNTVGLQLVAQTKSDDGDVSETGRQRQPCAGCHFQSWYALDYVASVLTRRSGEGDAMTFLPPPEGTKYELGGTTVTNDRELLDVLVASENYKFAQCRLAFRYLYGRDENTCEGELFDRCVDAMAQTGLIQAGLSAIAQDPQFCD